MTAENKPSGQNGLTYAQAGVDIDAGNLMVERIKPLVRSTRRPGADGEIGGFGGLFDLKAAGFSDPVLVAANDGVGTKLKIAIDADRHDTVGIDLVAMCVNDLVVQGAEPLFFLDYFATGKLSPDQGVAIVAGIAEGCRQAACALIGGETAEMPGMYRDGDYDLAGFAVGAAERSRLLPRGDVAEGDVILGLASSGVHSNGFSLVRRIVELSGLGWASEAPFQPDATLDLHGHNLRSAHALLDAGLERSIARGDRVLLLVTGKPPRPESERPHARGAIRAAVADWIAASRHAPHIAALRNAHPRHGGNGAIYVVFRRSRPKH